MTKQKKNDGPNYLGWATLLATVFGGLAAGAWTYWQDLKSDKKEYETFARDKKPDLNLSGRPKISEINYLLDTADIKRAASHILRDTGLAPPIGAKIVLRVNFVIKNASQHKAEILQIFTLDKNSSYEDIREALIGKAKMDKGELENKFPELEVRPSDSAKYEILDTLVVNEKMESTIHFLVVYLGPGNTVHDLYVWTNLILEDKMEISPMFKIEKGVVYARKYFSGKAALKDVLTVCNIRQHSYTYSFEDAKEILSFIEAQN
jgi:hypothetical protein